MCGKYFPFCFPKSHCMSLYFLFITTGQQQVSVLFHDSMKPLKDDSSFTILYLHTYPTHNLWVWAMGLGWFGACTVDTEIYNQVLASRTETFFLIY